MISVHVMIPGKFAWFQNGKLTLDPDRSREYANYTYFRTVKRARTLARGILNRHPDATVFLGRQSKSNGKFYVEEWRR